MSKTLTRSLALLLATGALLTGCGVAAPATGVRAAAPTAVQAKAAASITALVAAVAEDAVALRDHDPDDRKAWTAFAKASRARLGQVRDLAKAEGRDAIDREATRTLGALTGIEAGLGVAYGTPVAYSLTRTRLEPALAELRAAVDAPAPAPKPVDAVAVGLATDVAEDLAALRGHDDQDRKAWTQFEARNRKRFEQIRGRAEAAGRSDAAKLAARCRDLLAGISAGLSVAYGTPVAYARAFNELPKPLAELQAALAAQ